MDINPRNRRCQAVDLVVDFLKPLINCQKILTHVAKIDQVERAHRIVPVGYILFIAGHVTTDQSTKLKAQLIRARINPLGRLSLQNYMKVRVLFRAATYLLLAAKVH